MNTFRPPPSVRSLGRHIGFILISGPDAARFLQGQLTCDVNKLPSFGGYCNIQGRLMSFFKLWQSPFEQMEGTILQCPRNIVDSTLSMLKKYAVFSKVTLTNISDKLFIIGSAHPLTPLLIQQKNILVQPVLSDQPELFEIISPDLYLINTLRLQLLNNPDFHKETEALSWQSLKILAKIPELTPETQGLFLPHNLGLPELKAISFDKGCYLGQEIIARMHYKSTIKKHLYIFTHTLKDNTQLQPGTELYIHNLATPIGHIVNHSQPFLLLSGLDEYLKDKIIIPLQIAYEGTKSHLVLTRYS